MPWKASQHPSPKNAVGSEFEPCSHPVHSHFQGFLCATKTVTVNMPQICSETAGWQLFEQSWLSLMAGWFSSWWEGLCPPVCCRGRYTRSAHPGPQEGRQCHILRFTEERGVIRTMSACPGGGNSVWTRPHSAPLALLWPQSNCCRHNEACGLQAFPSAKVRASPQRKKEHLSAAEKQLKTMWKSTKNAGN